ncbi:MAG: hypothetical protein L0Y74_09910, partial [candidate division Zixibacteria bacterium]|nr:hypothetical protein [candidate division Zixibacteria bacterium]
PHRPNEINRGGSFVSVDFLIQYQNVALQEILFHTFESCSVFAPGWEKAVAASGHDGEGFPERWYSPDEFAKQHSAFQNKDSLPGYDLITINKVNYYYSCRYYEPGGVYSIQTMTFMGDIRIMIVLFSSYLYNCDKIYEESKNLLSKIEFIPYQPKKK